MFKIVFLQDLISVLGLLKMLIYRGMCCERWIYGSVKYS